MNKRKYLISFLIGLAITCLVSLSAAAWIRSAAGRLLSSVTDEATIELLAPLRYLTFRISPLPAAIGAVVLSLPVYGISKTRRTGVRAAYVFLILLLIAILFFVSLFTLRIGLASMFRIIYLLIRTLFQLT